MKQQPIFLASYKGTHAGAAGAVQSWHAMAHAKSLQSQRDLHWASV